jgi:hypothetical protein
MFAQSLISFQGDFVDSLAVVTKQQEQVELKRTHWQESLQGRIYNYDMVQTAILGFKLSAYISPYN